MSEGRYLPLLCLVGAAVPAMDAAGFQQRAELVDSLDEAVDVTPLAEVLADPEVQVVVHAGRQDVALLRRAWRTEVHNLFDTQIAAGFAGFGAQTSYGGLLADVLGLRLPKSASFTRWDIRPLTAEQVAYARDDVVPLLSLADALERRLTTSGRLEWAREETRRLEGASDERDPPSAASSRRPCAGAPTPSSRRSSVGSWPSRWCSRTASGWPRAPRTIR